MEFCISAVRQTTVNNIDGTSREVRHPVTIGLRASINPATNISDSDSEPYAGQVYSYPGNRISATNSFNEEEGNYIKTNGLDIVKTEEIDKLFTIMCESGNNFFENYFVLNVVECPETQDLSQQLSKGSGANTKLFKVESLKTIFYSYPFRCSIVSNILKFIDCCTVRRVTTERDLSDRCVICICNYDLGQDTRTLPCLHKFHRKCIDEWVVHDRCCPFCRLKIQFCSHKQCKMITIDNNFANNFEVPPPVSPPEPVQNDPSAVEEDDIDRAFNLSFGDLDMLAGEEIDFVTFRETVQAILNLASERHNVDVVAMFEDLQPSSTNQGRPTTSNTARAPRSAAEEPPQNLPNSGFRIPAEGFRRAASTGSTQHGANNQSNAEEILMNKRLISSQIDKTTEPVVKRQKSDSPTTSTCTRTTAYNLTSTPSTSSAQELKSSNKNVTEAIRAQSSALNKAPLSTLQEYAQAERALNNSMTSWTSSENLSLFDNQPTPMLIENQSVRTQNEPIENVNISIEFDGSSNSDTVEIDVTGLSQGSVSVSETSSCDDVHVDHNVHTIIVENCICCNHDDIEVIDITNNAD